MVFKSHLADTLFGKTRQAVLGLFFTNIEASFHLREICRRCNIAPGAVQREVKRLAEAGIIIRENRGMQTFYQVNHSCQIFTDLHNLILKTIGLGDKLRTALQPVEDHIDFAFLYGSFAKGTENKRSDIDLLLIGDISLLDVVKAFNKLNLLTDYEINPIVYSAEEYRKKISAGHYFLISLLDQPKVFLIGSEDEFKKLG